MNIIWDKKLYLDEISALDNAKKEGKKIKATEIVKNLLDISNDEKISMITGLLMFLFIEV